MIVYQLTALIRLAEQMAFYYRKKKQNAIVLSFTHQSLHHNYHLFDVISNCTLISQQ